MNASELSPVSDRWLVTSPLSTYLLSMLFWGITSVGLGLLIGLVFLDRPVSLPEPKLDLFVAPPPAVESLPDTVLQRCEDRVREILEKESIHFASGSARITEAGMVVIDRILPELQACRNASLIISGHTDSTGDAQANLVLSERRAQAVANALTQKGLAGFRIKTMGFGESRPAASNQTVTGRYKNRRIEIQLKSPGEVL